MNGPSSSPAPPVRQVGQSVGPTPFWSLVVLASAVVGALTFAVVEPGPASSAGATPDLSEQTVVAPPKDALVDATLPRAAEAEVAVDPAVEADLVASGELTVFAPDGEAPSVSTPGATPGAPGTATDCTASGGWTLTVPAGWYTAEGALACQVFAPWPLGEATLETDVAAALLVVDQPLDQVLLAGVPADRAYLDGHETTIAGRRAIVETTMQLVDGESFAAGTAIHEIRLDDGGRTLWFVTWDDAGDVSAFASVLGQLAASLR